MKLIQIAEKYLIATVILVILFSLPGLAFLLGYTNPFWSWLQPSPPTAASNISITELQEMGDLVVLKVNTTDVLEGTGGGHKGMWIVNGDALLAVDMRDVEEMSRDDEEHRATFRLPCPTVLSPRVNHEKTRMYDIKKNEWIAYITGGDQKKLHKHAMQHAQRMIEEVAGQDEHVDTARENAEMQVNAIYSNVGWNVDVVWADGWSRDAEPVAE